ncbi:MAG: hypothetical protein WAM90_15575 [Rhodanobacter sp.]
MNDEAYDISHLLESEPVKADVPELRIVRAPPAVAARTVVISAQEAMAQELLKAAEAHEEMIRQYLRISGDPVDDPYWQ